MGPGHAFSGPPANFDPVSASDADLACYGFPPRPPGQENLAHWTKVMSLHHPE